MVSSLISGKSQENSRRKASPIGARMSHTRMVRLVVLVLAVCGGLQGSQHGATASLPLIIPRALRGSHAVGDLPVCGLLLQGLPY